MSAITSDWASIATEAPAARTPEGGKVCRREEEFRLALDNYMAGYDAAQRKRSGAAAGSMGSEAARELG